MNIKKSNIIGQKCTVTNEYLQPRSFLNSLCWCCTTHYFQLHYNYNLNWLSVRNLVQLHIRTVALKWNISTKQQIILEFWKLQKCVVSKFVSK